MITGQSSWITEFAQALMVHFAPERSSTVRPWEIREDRAAAVCLAKLRDACYRIVGFEPLGWGFSLGLLGAQYGQACKGLFRSLPLDSIVEEGVTKGRFYLLIFQSPDGASEPLPFMTLLEDRAGNWHMLETSFEQGEAFCGAFTVAAHLLAEQSEDPARFDDYGDFLTLGAPCIVQRHGTERLQKHVSKKVVYDPEFCNHCLRCATVCSEMRAIVTEKGAQLLGPVEDFCTNCGLCRKRCSFLIAKPKDELQRPADHRSRPDKRGSGVYLYGASARMYREELEHFRTERPSWFPYNIVNSGPEIPDFLPDGDRSIFPDAQIRLDIDSVPGFEHRSPLLMTSIPEDAGTETVMVRTAYRAALVFQTKDGEVEKAMARAALRLGLEVVATAQSEESDSSIPINETTQLFYRMGRWRHEPLSDLWNRGEVDLILAPYGYRLPAELHRRVMEDTGKQASILSPHIVQALPVTQSPLLKQLTAELQDIFMKYPELMETEARFAQKLLEDIPRNSALLHARYRTMAIAPGHSACPTCAEAQVLAIPIYMSIAMSLARGEIPHVTYTCETGCMSETLVKTNEVAQKVPGGRTVFGGGFAFGEAVTMAEDRAVRMGYLKKGRRYVVSQGGDGGSVIGLPAWLNALRQQAFLIRQRYSNVLHFITITDTQVYSNTGGEGSASSLLGMSTLTTPIGKFLLGNQKIQWSLINLAAEFPGILVGMGHSANKTAIRQFWHQADQLGQSGIRWDVTPCPETGKFFGDDPDDLAEVMAHAGMLPEVVFVGRFRKRVAPFHPEDRNKPYREWRREPQPVLYWLHRDPRYRSLFRKNPQTGQPEPANLTAHFIINQLESYRDQLNRQIDLETNLVRKAEEWVGALFRELEEARKHYFHQSEQFPYAVLFNRQGGLKPEYAGSLEQEMVRRILGWVELTRYATVRDQVSENHHELLQEFVGELEKFEKVSEDLSNAPEGRKETVKKTLSRIQDLNESLKEEVRKLQTVIEEVSRSDPIEKEFLAYGGESSQSLSEKRRKDLYELLDRILEERALAGQTELQQHRLAQQLRQDFLQKGGLIQASGSKASVPEREALRRQIAHFGPFSIGVASLAGDRGIAINRIFAQFFTDKGVWAGMAWQFGSSKRGTPVLSTTFVDARPLQRKDAMYTFPMAVLTVTNYEEMKRQPDLFFGQLHPRGFLIINHRKSPEILWRELVESYPEAIRKSVDRLRERFRTDGEKEPDSILDETARDLWEKPYAQLPGDLRHQVRKVAAMACARVLTVDMDGIMQEVTGSSKVVSNLVAIGPMFEALRELGFPFDWNRDLPILTHAFPGAVLKNKQLLNHYYQAMEKARRLGSSEAGRSIQSIPTSQPLAPCLSPLASRRLPASQPPSFKEDPAECLMIMGGTLAGMVLSQIATSEHPLFYVGFPITPAGNPFYAMADAFANGHPYIVVDEVNPSEKVAAEKLLGIARTGGFLPVTFTASQGWRLFTEIIPQFVGARLEGLFLIAKRALAAPNLNIEESHTDFMSFRDDGGIMLAPKSIQEYVPSLYLARLLTHFAKLPVILSIGGITDTHKIGLVRVPSDDRVRSWLSEKLKGFDFLEHKLLNRQGELIVHGPSGTSAVYQETQSEIEKAHQAAARIYPYAVQAVYELTGVRPDELEVAVQETQGVRRKAQGESEDGSSAETVFILQGSLYPNAVEALRQLEEKGWSGMACLSVRCFNPFPEEKLAPWLDQAERIVVLDRSDSFGSIPPLASRVYTTYARLVASNGDSKPKPLRTLVGGLGGREITVDDMEEIFLSTHLFFRPPQSWESPLVEKWLEEDDTLKTLLGEAAALDLRNTDRHTRVPPHLRSPEARQGEYEARLVQLRQLLIAKNYPALLAGYHQVEFIRPREVLQETSLLQQIVLYLEIRLARHALGMEQGTLRHALILLHYSQEIEDHPKARSVLKEEVRNGHCSGRLAASYGVAADLPIEEEEYGKDQLISWPSEVQREDVFDVTEVSDGFPDPELDPEEAGLIETVLTEMVALQGEKPLFYNPEDYEHELLRTLRHHHSQSYLGKLEREAANGVLTVDQTDALVWKYRCCYRNIIDRTLQREVLAQHHAPELREFFEGKGRKRLEALVKGIESHLTDETPENKRRILLAETERYLSERCFPHYSKTPVLYLEYFRNWVAPDLLKLLSE